MKSIVALFLSIFWFAMPELRAAEKWTPWPAGSHEAEPSLQIPPNFKRIPSPVKQADPTILNSRFRSLDGTVEFAVTAVYARRMGMPAQKAN
jgi:hypothetical protein